MYRFAPRGLWIGGAVALVVGLALAVPAAANHIDDCNVYCDTFCEDNPLAPGYDPNCRQADNGVCTLLDENPATELVCLSGDGPIELRNGTDLDMIGKTIRCGETWGGSPGSCPKALLVTGAQSEVFDSLAAGGGFSGPFLTAIDCGGQVNSKVTGIRIDDALYAVFNCRKVEDNRIGNYLAHYLTINVGVYTESWAGTDYVRGNYIHDRQVGVWIGSGDKGVNVEENVIQTTPGAGSFGAARGIYITSATSKALVRRNVLQGTGATFYASPFPLLVDDAGSTASYDSNVCDRDHPDCDACQTAGFCTPFEAPFDYNP